MNFYILELVRKSRFVVVPQIKSHYKLLFFYMSSHVLELVRKIVVCGSSYKLSHITNF
ncbi:hypothetical protein LEP1GSC041_3308 [Leptospira noguchii str. 2006001870]|nr:hypothetical protein LEP1GSC041_3308 [Leptospira noguchii str. 2006001870]